MRIVSKVETGFGKRAHKRKNLRSSAQTLYELKNAIMGKILKIYQNKAGSLNNSHKCEERGKGRQPN